MRFCLPVEHLENDSCYLDSLLVGGVWLELELDSIVVAPGQCVGLWVLSLGGCFWISYTGLCMIKLFRVGGVVDGEGGQQ